MPDKCDLCSSNIKIPQPFDLEGLVVCPHCLEKALRADPDLPDPRLVSFWDPTWGTCYQANEKYRRQLKAYLGQGAERAQEIQ